VLGVSIAAVTPELACTAVREAALEGLALTLSALAVHGVMTGALDAEHRSRLNALDLLVPDGQPVRWALNLLHGAKLRERVYGPSLMLDICAMAEKDGLPIALYGSRIETLLELQRRIEQRFPNLRIVFSTPSRFSRLCRSEQIQIAEQIAASGARVLFVGLGCPRQEVWLYEHRDILRMPMLAVGAAFDFHAGRLPQAPSWMQRRGLEWMFRLCSEPQRLWRRYMLLNPLYIVLLLLQATGALPRLQRRQAPVARYQGFG
jgi:exopolysaccharide biosynthesis WecB/TagA/CpsF family protein